METARQNLRTLVRGAYDIQKLRIQMGNRIAGNFRSKLGQKPSEKLEEREAKKVITQIKAEYSRLTDGIVGNIPTKAKFVGSEVISTYTELVLVDQYMELSRQEERHFKQLAKVLDEFEIYKAFLKDVSGVGPAMAGVIISEIDITRAQYPSSLWAYAGLDVAPDGKGRSRKKEHLVKQTYKDHDGNDAIKNGITFNPFLKTKLVGVLGSSFLKAGNKEGSYAEIYYQYKNRLENHAVYGVANDETRIAEFKAQGKGYAPKAHRHNMATRYVVKRFLVDLYVAWRKIEGLPVAEEYSVAKLGKVHKTA